MSTKIKRKMFKKWINVLIKPKETFRKERNNASGEGAAKMVAVAGIIMGIIYVVGFTFFDTPPMSVFGSHEFGGKMLYGIVMILFMPMYAIIQVFMLSLVLYLFAKILGCKGDITIQTYLISLFAAPLMIIYILAIILPHGKVIAIITILYFLYLLVLALNETYNG